MIPELENADLEAILAPLPGDPPTGADLREDHSAGSVYLRLRDARTEARAAERQADADGGDEAALRALWRPVASQAVDVLKSNAKDLEVATWLTEGLVRTSGLQGLTAGATIIAGLVEQFWDALYPTPDDQGVATRVAAVAGLSGQGADGTLMQSLRKSILFLRTDTSPFHLWQYQATLDLAGITDPERRAQRIEAGVVPFDDVEIEARAAGPAHWTAQRETVAQALAAWEAMEKALDAKAGPDSPSGRRVHDLLVVLSEICGRFAPATPAAEEEAVVAAGAIAEGSVMTGSPTKVTGREQAIRQLEEVATWFKLNEPNSPIGFTLEEAVRRARLAWPDLIFELVADDTARQALMISAGVKRPVSGE